MHEMVSTKVIAPYSYFFSKRIEFKSVASNLNKIIFIKKIK